MGYAANAKLSSTHGLDESTVVLVETSLMKFRNDLMIGGNASAQTNPTPKTQVCMCRVCVGGWWVQILCLLGNQISSYLI